MAAADLILDDLRTGDLGWLVRRHGELYRADEGYDLRFEALVARVVSDFVTDRGPHDRAWIARDKGGVRQGSIFCVRLDETTAKLRLFLIEPDWRGTGLADRLMDAVIDHARGWGATSLVLWTHESHRAAGRLYARRGFDLLDQTPVEAFGVPTVEQNWRLTL